MNPMLYNAVQLAPPDTRKVYFPMGASTPHVIRGIWTHPTQHHELQFDRFSRFHTAHGRESLYFAMCVKTDARLTACCPGQPQ